MADYKTSPLQFYIRVATPDEAASKKEIAGIFENPDFLSRNNEPDGEYAFVTGKMTEYELEDKLKAMSPDYRILQQIRVLDY